MNLNMTEHGLNVNISYNESDDFDNAEILSLVNRLVEVLRDVEDININISSEFVIDSDADEVLEDMASEYEEESDDEDESHDKDQKDTH